MQRHNKRHSRSQDRGGEAARLLACPCCPPCNAALKSGCGWRWRDGEGALLGRRQLDRSCTGCTAQAGNVTYCMSYSLSYSISNTRRPLILVCQPHCDPDSEDVDFRKGSCWEQLPQTNLGCHLNSFQTPRPSPSNARTGSEPESEQRLRTHGSQRQDEEKGKCSWRVRLPAYPDQSCS